MRKLLITVIKLYQLAISPLLGQNCRFYPACSSYAVEALEKHGILRGCFLMVKRIARCHPFNEGGYDPVPETQLRSKCCH